MATYPDPDPHRMRLRRPVGPMTGFDLYMPQGMAVCDYVTGIGIWFNNIDVNRKEIYVQAEIAIVYCIYL